MQVSEMVDGSEPEDSIAETAPFSDGGEQPKSVWLNGYVFGLIMLAAVGFLLIALGALVFPQGSFPNILLIGVGIALGPAAVVGIVFRIFLFGEVRYELTRPLITEVRSSLRHQVREQIDQMVAGSRREIQETVNESKHQIKQVGEETDQLVAGSRQEIQKLMNESKHQIQLVGEQTVDVAKGYQAEIPLLKHLRKAGIDQVYRSREQALKEILQDIQEEKSEIMIVGSSLKGLLQMEPEYGLVAEVLKGKIEENETPVRFLLTHPAVADLRAGQEQRSPTEIGDEIIQSIKILKSWGVPPENVRLYKATPTCFAIKTSRKMLLNPYPYAAVAYDSPCFIVSASAESGEDRGYFYDAFKISHFRAYETEAAERITDYNATIMALKENLRAYAKNVQKMLAPPEVKEI